MKNTELTRMVAEWAEARGSSPSKTLDEAGISPSRFREWDNGARPERDSLIAIADVIGQPRNKLLALYGYPADQADGGLTKAESLLLEWFRMIPKPQHRLIALNTVRTLSGLEGLSDAALLELLGNGENQGA